FDVVVLDRLQDVFGGLHEYPFWLLVEVIWPPAATVGDAIQSREAQHNIGESAGPSDGVQSGFAGSDANGLLDVGHENLAVADPPGLRRAPDRVDRLLDQIVRNHDFDFDLGQKVHDVLGAAIEFGVTFLPPEALGFRDGDALESNFLERFLHLVELEWLDDGLDLLHWRLPGNSMASALRRCATCSILEPVEPPSAGIYCRSNQAIRSRLPQKQGLCQIGRLPDFETLSDY